MQNFIILAKIGEGAYSTVYTVKRKEIKIILINMGIGDWGLGIGDWDWAQSPIPNPQSPIPNPHIINFNDYLNYLTQNIKTI